ncbi:unnamed protein product [Prorocentrum cordatum]|uniref:Uncharacterized protein n=1 Tax=Prorocentrum cordatum TaxID=2364126 RepID=A0ABN9VFH4_9DINO|nr:unnamed protein product [Polarella glacialis]
MLPGRWIGCVKVRWESTVPFELGVMSVDGIPRVSRRLSVTVCRWGEPQIEALLAALRRRGAAAARGAAGGAAATPAEGRQGAAEAPRPTVAAHRGRRLLRRRLPAKEGRGRGSTREEGEGRGGSCAGALASRLRAEPEGHGDLAATRVGRAATRMTSGGRMARCYIGPKAEIAWSKKKVEQLEGRTLEATIGGPVRRPQTPLLHLLARSASPLRPLPP